MAALTNYTTYAEVRAVLGVSNKELADSVLSLGLYPLALERELRGVSATLPAQYEVIRAKLVGDRTPQEQLLYDAVRLWAPYQVVHQLGSGVPLFSMKSVTDGKAGFTRDANSPYKEALARAESMYATLRADLVSAYSTFSGGSTEVVELEYIRSVAPSIDPVTGV